MDEDLCDMEGCHPNTHFAVYILSPTPDQRTTIWFLHCSFSLSLQYALYQTLWLTLFQYVIHCIKNCKTCYWVQNRTSELVGHVNFYHWRGLGTRGILSKRYNRTNTQIRPEWGGNTLQSYPRHIHRIKVGMENTNLNESWHRITLFLQAKCMCVWFQVARGWYFGNAATQQ